MDPDAEATASLGARCEDGEVIYANLPDEEQEALKKVDFSILGRELTGFFLLRLNQVCRTTAPTPLHTHRRSCISFCWSL